MRVCVSLDMDAYPLMPTDAPGKRPRLGGPLPEPGEDPLTGNVLPLSHDQIVEVDERKIRWWIDALRNGSVSLLIHAQELDALSYFLFEDPDEESVMEHRKTVAFDYGILAALGNLVARIDALPRQDDASRAFTMQLITFYKELGMQAKHSSAVRVLSDAAAWRFFTQRMERGSNHEEAAAAAHAIEEMLRQAVHDWEHDLVPTFPPDLNNFLTQVVSSTNLCTLLAHKLQELVSDLRDTPPEERPYVPFVRLMQCLLIMGVNPNRVSLDMIQQLGDAKVVEALVTVLERHAEHREHAAEADDDMEQMAIGMYNRTVIDVLESLIDERELHADNALGPLQNARALVDAGGVQVLIEACLADADLSEENSMRGGTLKEVAVILYCACETGPDARELVMYSPDVRYVTLDRFWPTPDFVEGETAPYAPTRVPKILQLLTIQITTLRPSEALAYANLLSHLAARNMQHETILVRALTRRIRGFVGRLTSEPLKAARAAMDPAETEEADRHALDAQIAGAVTTDQIAIRDYGFWFYALAQLTDNVSATWMATAEVVVNGGETKLLQLLKMEAMPIERARRNQVERNLTSMVSILRVIKRVAYRGERGLQKLHVLDATETLRELLVRIQNEPGPKAFRSSRAICACLRYLLEGQAGTQAREHFVRDTDGCAALVTEATWMTHNERSERRLGRWYGFEVDCTHALSSVTRVLEPGMGIGEWSTARVFDEMGRLFMGLHADEKEWELDEGDEEARERLDLARLDAVARFAEWGGVGTNALISNGGFGELQRKLDYYVGHLDAAYEGFEYIVPHVKAVVRAIECFLRSNGSITYEQLEQGDRDVFSVRLEHVMDAHGERFPQLKMPVYKALMQVHERPTWDEGDDPELAGSHLYAMHKYRSRTIGVLVETIRPAVDRLVQGANRKELLVGEVLAAFYELMDYRWLFYDVYEAPGQKDWHLWVVNLGMPSLYVHLLRHGTEVQRCNSLRALKRLVSFKTLRLDKLYSWPIVSMLLPRQAEHVGPANRTAWGAPGMRNDKKMSLSELLVAYSTEDAGRAVMWQDDAKLFKALFHLSPALRNRRLNLRNFGTYNNTDLLMLARMVEAAHNATVAQDPNAPWRKEDERLMMTRQERLRNEPEDPNDRTIPEDLLPKIIESAEIARYAAPDALEEIRQTPGRIVNILLDLFRLGRSRSDGWHAYLHNCVVWGHAPLLRLLERGIMVDSVFYVLTVAINRDAAAFRRAFLPNPSLDFPTHCFTLAQVPDDDPSMPRYLDMLGGRNADANFKVELGNNAALYLITVCEALTNAWSDDDADDAERARARERAIETLDQFQTFMLPQKCREILSPHSEASIDRMQYAARLLKALIDVADQLPVAEEARLAHNILQTVPLHVHDLWHGVSNPSLNWDSRIAACAVLRWCAERVDDADVPAATLGNLEAYEGYLKVRNWIEERNCDRLLWYVTLPGRMRDVIEERPDLYDVLMEHFVDNDMCGDVWDGTVLQKLRDMLGERAIMKMAALSYRGPSSRAGRDLVAFMWESAVAYAATVQHHITRLELPVIQAICTYEKGPLALLTMPNARLAAATVVNRNQTETMALDIVNMIGAIVHGNERLQEYLDTLDQLQKLGGEDWDLGQRGPVAWGSPGHQTALRLRRLIHEDPYSPLWIHTQIYLKTSQLGVPLNELTPDERWDAFALIFSTKDRGDSILNADPNVGPAYLNQMVGGYEL